MNYYYAVFEYDSDGINASFPDLPGCLTCGSDMEEAYEMAVDALAGWMKCAEEAYEKEKEQYIPKYRSTYNELKDKYPDCVIMLIQVDEDRMREYKGRTWT